jgi:hypothetical protein
MRPGSLGVAGGSGVVAAPVPRGHQDFDVVLMK